MVTAVIPMAGRGERFFEAGFNVPKYMVEVKGRTLFEYSLLSLPFEVIDRAVFVGLDEHNVLYGLEAFIRDKVRSIAEKTAYTFDTQIILIEEVTGGQAETVLKAKNDVDLSKDIIIYNIDTHFKSCSLCDKLSDPDRKKDGVLGAFELHKQDPKWSFAKLGADGLVSETAEKDQISNYALTGMYHFTCGQDFVDVAEDCIRFDRRTKGEFYIAPLYNLLIDKDCLFVIDIADEFAALGTPEEVELFRTTKG